MPEFNLLDEINSHRPDGEKPGTPEFGSAMANLTNDDVVGMIRSAFGYGVIYGATEFDALDGPEELEAAFQAHLVHQLLDHLNDLD